MAKNTQQLLLDIGQGLSVMIGLPRIATWNTSERPTKAKRGTIGFNSQTNSLEFFSGSDWFSAPLTTL